MLYLFMFFMNSSLVKKIKWSKEIIYSELFISKCKDENRK